MNTQALATFGVYRRASADELAVLELANEFRQRLCALQHAKYCAEVDYRNAHYPNLYAALVRSEQLYFRIAELERRIKAHHSEVRDRNAVPEELRAELETARRQRQAARAIVTAERREYSDFLKRFRAAWKTAADWKNVKSLAKRRAAYAALTLPDEVREYAELFIKHDLLIRELGIEYQSRGLHSAIRAEIVEATKPKFGKTGPGTRYEYHRSPRCQPWQKITLQFAGGLTVSDAIAGKNPSLRLRQVGEKVLASRTHTFYRVTQQIGTTAEPRTIEYDFKAHRPLPPDAIIQRWTLAVRESGKREVIPIVKHDFAKPQGTGIVAYKLSWTRRKAGVEVCRFWGSQVNERVIIPQATIDQRLAMATARARADLQANALLAERGATPPPNRRQGVAALSDWVANHPEDNAAVNLLFDCNRDLAFANQQSRRAQRRIEKIYETIASRVCRLHGTIVHDPIPLDKIKLYDGRDLLREDRLPLKSRTYLHAVAPGKLRALLKGYGLASGDVAPPEPNDARETDVFTSYVTSLGQPDTRRRAGRRRRSQRAAQVVAR